MFHFWVKYPFKGIVQFEINFKSAYLKGIQNVGVFFGQTGVVCQSYDAEVVHLKEHAQRSQN